MGVNTTLLSVVYDATDKEFWAAYADGTDPAHNQTYVHFDLAAATGVTALDSYVAAPDPISVSAMAMFSRVVSDCQISINAALAAPHMLSAAAAAIVFPIFLPTDYVLGNVECQETMSKVRARNQQIGYISDLEPARNNVKCQAVKNTDEREFCARCACGSLSASS